MVELTNRATYLVEKLSNYYIYEMRHEIRYEIRYEIGPKLDTRYDRYSFEDN